MAVKIIFYSTERMFASPETYDGDLITMELSFVDRWGATSSIDIFFDDSKREAVFAVSAAINAAFPDKTELQPAPDPYAGSIRTILGEDAIDHDNLDF